MKTKGAVPKAGTHREAVEYAAWLADSSQLGGYGSVRYGVWQGPSGQGHFFSSEEEYPFWFTVDRGISDPITTRCGALAYCLSAISSRQWNLRKLGPPRDWSGRKATQQEIDWILGSARVLQGQHDPGNEVPVWSNRTPGVCKCTDEPPFPTPEYLWQSFYGSHKEWSPRVH